MKDPFEFLNKKASEVPEGSQDEYEYVWPKLKPGPNHPPSHGEIRSVLLEVECLFQWSDEIIDEYDFEEDKVISYKSGLVMKVLPQTLVYKGQETHYLYTVCAEIEHWKEGEKEKEEKSED